MERKRPSKSPRRHQDFGLTLPIVAMRVEMEKSGKFAPLSFCLWYLRPL